MSNLNKIQTFQNISYYAQDINKCSSYIPNHTLHTDLKIKTIIGEVKCFYKRFRNRLASHTSLLIKNLTSILLIPGDLLRRLKHTWCQDLLQD